MGRLLTFPIKCMRCKAQSHDLDFLSDHRCGQVHRTTTWRRRNAG